MGKDLYVRNIPLEAREEDVRKLFSVIGRVSYIHLVTDARTGQLKGYGYVKMSSEAEAKEAVTSLNGARLVNRVIFVSEALPQQQAPGKRGVHPGKTDRGKKPVGRKK